MLEKLLLKELFKNSGRNRRFNWKKIADKITSVDKTKSKQKQKQKNK